MAYQKRNNIYRIIRLKEHVNGSKEGLTSAELAGVEKADALLVSQKVGYEDVWDLRNVGDLLESGSKGGTLAKGLIGHDFEDYLSKIIGGES